MPMRTRRKNVSETHSSSNKDEKPKPSRKPPKRLVEEDQTAASSPNATHQVPRRRSPGTRSSKLNKNGEITQNESKKPPKTRKRMKDEKMANDSKTTIESKRVRKPSRKLLDIDSAHEKRSRESTKPSNARKKTKNTERIKETSKSLEQGGQTRLKTENDLENNEVQANKPVIPAKTRSKRIATARNTKEKDEVKSQDESDDPNKMLANQPKRNTRKRRANLTEMHNDDNKNEVKAGGGGSKRNTKRNRVEKDAQIESLGEQPQENLTKRPTRAAKGKKENKAQTEEKMAKARGLPKKAINKENSQQNHFVVEKTGKDNKSVRQGRTKSINEEISSSPESALESNPESVVGSTRSTREKKQLRSEVQMELGGTKQASKAADDPSKDEGAKKFEKKPKEMSNALQRNPTLKRNRLSKNDLNMSQNDQNEKGCLISGKDDLSKENKANSTIDDTSCQKKVPIYCQKEELPYQKKADTAGPKMSGLQSKKSLKRKSYDVFDVDYYGEEEFGPEDKTKKRRRKRRPKQKGDIILTFGQQKRDKAFSVLKEVKNLKTPEAANIKKQNGHLPIITGTSCLESTITQSKPSQSKQNDIVPRECDDFFPTFYQGITEDVNNTNLLSVPDRNQSNIGATTAARTKLNNDKEPGDTSTNVQPVLRRYKTPNVPKHVSKREGKVSTPRMEEKAEGKMTTQDLIKVAFGFDDESSQDDESSAEGESLLGISPVRSSNSIGGVHNHNFFSPNQSNSIYSKPLQRKNEAALPARFTLFDNVRKNHSNRSQVSTYHWKPDRSEMRPLNESLTEIQKNAHIRKFKNLSGRSNTPLKTFHQDKNSGENCEAKRIEETHLFEDEDLAEKPDANPDIICDEASKMSANEVNGGSNPANPVEDNVEKTTALKERTNVPLRDPKEKDIVVKAPPKKVKHKQTKIYEVLGNSNDHNHSRKQISTHNTTSVDDDNNANESIKTEEPRKSNRSYGKKTLHTSVTSSPQKHNKKQDKKIEAWASLQSSHFSEVEEFDLSFV